MAQNYYSFLKAGSENCFLRLGALVRMIFLAKSGGVLKLPHERVRPRVMRIERRDCGPIFLRLSRSIAANH